MVKIYSYSVEEKKETTLVILSVHNKICHWFNHVPVTKRTVRHDTPGHHTSQLHAGFDYQPFVGTFTLDEHTHLTRKMSVFGAGEKKFE